MLEGQFSSASIETLPLKKNQSKKPNGDAMNRDVDETAKQQADLAITLARKVHQVSSCNIPDQWNLSSYVEAKEAAMSTTQQSDVAIDQGEVKQSRFRVYQEKNWADMRDRLFEFRELNGHCNVPTSHENQSLARWVKRQRYQYSLLLDERDESTLTPERVKALEQMGFVWDPQSEKWNQLFEQLKLFKQLHGHANVPATYEEHLSLGLWVKAQRRQYVLQQEGKPTFMSPNRIRLLESVGMEWIIRKRNTKPALSLP